MRAEATAATLARRHTENAALRQRMAELKPWSGRSRGGSYQEGIASVKPRA
jgi:hypothetical protein